MEFHPIAYPVVCSTNAVQFGFSCRHVEPMHVSLVVVACAIHGCYRRRFVRGSKGRCQSINVRIMELGKITPRKIIYSITVCCPRVPCRV